MAGASTEGLVRASLSEIEKLINPTDFLRIHRNTIIQLRWVDRICRDPLGRLVISMVGSEENLAVSQPYKSPFKAM